MSRSLGLIGFARALGVALTFAAALPAAHADGPPAPPASAPTVLPPPKHVPGGPPPAPPPKTRKPDPGVVRRDEPRAPAPSPAASGLGNTSGGIVIRVDFDVGEIKAFEAEEGTLLMVLTGNPTIRAEDGTLSIKARTLVLWVDSKSSPELMGFLGKSPERAGGADAKGAPETKMGKPKKSPSGAVSPAGTASGEHSLLPAALVAVYAEGAVDLDSEGTVFRASELYLDARRNQALLVDPRLDMHVAYPGVVDPVRLHVRAERARIVSKGLAVLDRAEASTTRASAGVQLKIARLTVEEYGQVRPDDSTALGFRAGPSAGMTQHVVAEQTHGRGERLPLFYWPKASFGGENGVAEMPVTVKSPTIGSRSSFGRYYLLPVGKQFAVGADGKVDLTATLGWYTKRGPASGLDVEWKDRTVGLEGKASAYYVDDRSGEDRYGYQATEDDRWKVEAENRYDVSKTLRFDAEFNDFSDRGFNQEFFESDFYSHKDRETYGRARWMEGGNAVTLTSGFHMRDFVTETVDQPTATLWSESVPLIRPSTRGGIAVDLATVLSFGRLVHWTDKALDVPSYEAERMVLSERFYAPFDVGDVRVSPFVGVAGTGYYGRTDGGDDLTRATFEAGVRANLQLHRDFDVYGGRWALDGLRNTIDLDAGVFSRFGDTSRPQDVPVFDAVETERDRTEVFLEARGRLETRRVVGARRGVGGLRQNASLLDASVRLSLWPGEIGPYGKRGPGEVQAWLWAEILPGTMWLRADSISNLEGRAFEHSSVGIEYQPDDVLSLALGIRHVQDEVLAPWFDGAYRWSEKWGVRLEFLKDFEQDRADTLRVVLMRFLPDHIFDVGITIRHGGDDVGIVLNLHPAIGGAPTSPLAAPHDQIDRER